MAVIDASAILSQIASMIKTSEAVAAGNFLETVANAWPANPTDPGQQAAFVLAFHAAVATFLAQSAAALPADAAAASVSIKQMLLAAAASLKAAKV